MYSVPCLGSTLSVESVACLGSTVSVQSVECRVVL